MGGMVPVRWTAPEGLTDLKYSSASDVWSFGITCVEILQDGMLPYVEVGHRYSRVCAFGLFACLPVFLCNVNNPDDSSGALANARFTKGTLTNNNGRMWLFTSNLSTPTSHPDAEQPCHHGYGEFGQGTFDACWL